MKYWFIIKKALPEEVARALWDKLAPYKANFTVLFDRAYVHGDADDHTVQMVAVILAGTGLPVERG